MHYQRMLDPPHCPTEVRDLERLVAAFHPTPKHYTVPAKLYDTLVNYLEAYDKFAHEMGWIHRAVPEFRVPAIHGQTGLCYIRRYGT